MADTVTMTLTFSAEAEVIHADGTTDEVKP